MSNSTGFVFDSTETNHSGSYNKVYLDTHMGKRALFLERYHYKELVNENQLDHIVNYLIVENGFIMDRHLPDRMMFTHSQNNGTSTTYYNYYPESMEMEKFSRQFLHFV